MSKRKRKREQTEVDDEKNMRSSRDGERKSKKKKRRRSTSSSSTSSAASSSSNDRKRRKRKKSKKSKRTNKMKGEDLVGPAVPVDLPSIEEERPKMKPMTKEEWEKKQSVVQRVYDESTGRYRLIKGDGEVLEEIVSRDRHKEINKQATAGDGTISALGSLRNSTRWKGLSNIRNTGTFAGNEAFQVRETLKKYFMSSAGSVPWQMESISEGRLHD